MGRMVKKMDIQSPDVRDFVLSILAYGGGATAIAYFAFKQFSVSWLESIFSKKLEAFKHENTKEIEKFKFEIDGAMKARQRYQEKQFETIVELWQLYRSTSADVAALISPFQQYQNIEAMSEELRKQYLATFDLLPAQRDEVLRAPKIQIEFQKTVDRNRFRSAANSFSNFNAYLLAREVFLDEVVFGDFVKIADAMHAVLVARQIYNETEPEYRTKDERKWMQDELKSYDLASGGAYKRLVVELRRKYGDF